MTLLLCTSYLLVVAYSREVQCPILQKASLFDQLNHVCTHHDMLICCYMHDIMYIVLGTSCNNPQSMSCYKITRCLDTSSICLHCTCCLLNI